MKRAFATFGIAVGVLLALYVGGYFMIVREGVMMGMGRTETVFPTYRGVPQSSRVGETLFGPIHEIDRKYLRPTKWQHPIRNIQVSRP